MTLKDTQPPPGADFPGNEPAPLPGANALVVPIVTVSSSTNTLALTTTYLPNSFIYLSATR